MFQGLKFKTQDVLPQKTLGELFKVFLITLFMLCQYKNA